MALLREGLSGLGGRELAGRLADVERMIRKLEAVAVTIIAEADRCEVFGDDGHASVRGWVKASIRATDADVTHRVRCAALGRSHPRCLDELAAGRLGVAQVRELGRLNANRRCADHLGGALPGLLDAATSLSFEMFRDVARQWERIADSDGAHDDAEQRRSALRATQPLQGARLSNLARRPRPMARPTTRHHRHRRRMTAPMLQVLVEILRIESGRRDERSAHMERTSLTASGRAVSRACEPSSACVPAASARTSVWDRASSIRTRRLPTIVLPTSMTSMPIRWFGSRYQVRN
ncbi:MAG: hypothetical protein ACRDZ2_03840, partial [Ilumatobacteraceae bacterium]